MNSKGNEYAYIAVKLGMGCIMLCAALYLGKEAAEYVNATKVVNGQEEICVVIDAGHGGIDPGKVGVNDTKEKDINLLIAEQLKMYLEAQDIKVVMTRTGEEGLYDELSPNKKVQDMKNRIAIIDQTNPAIAVSIHQNSYQEEYVHGAQVFYYKNSEEGKILADILQKSLITRVDPANTRVPKDNDSYYLLKKTGTPIVIVECGFLSNWQEAELLKTKEYQDRLAWSIHMGIIQYLKQAD